MHEPWAEHVSRCSHVCPERHSESHTQRPPLHVPAFEHACTALHVGPERHKSLQAQTPVPASHVPAPLQDCCTVH